MNEPQVLDLPMGLSGSMTLVCPPRGRLRADVQARLDLFAEFLRVAGPRGRLHELPPHRRYHARLLAWRLGR